MRQKLRKAAEEWQGDRKMEKWGTRDRMQRGRERKKQL
jgi:hypothetical protein